MFKIALRIPLGRDLSPHRHVPLHARSSPRTRQIRDATAQSGFATHLLQVMHGTRAVPVCPSTPASMPERNHHVGRLTTAQRAA